MDSAMLQITPLLKSARKRFIVLSLVPAAILSSSASLAVNLVKTCEDSHAAMGWDFDRMVVANVGPAIHSVTGDVYGICASCWGQTEDAPGVFRGTSSKRMCLNLTSHAPPDLELDECTQGAAGNPVRLSDGAKFQREYDIQLPGHLQWQRTYTSQAKRWSFVFNTKPQGGSTGAGQAFEVGHFRQPFIGEYPQDDWLTVTVQLPDGAYSHWFRGADGTQSYTVTSSRSYAVSPVYDEPEDGGIDSSDGGGSLSSLSAVSNRNRSTAKFHRDGKLDSVSYPDGDVVSFTYDGLYLKKMQNRFGRWLSFAHNAEGELAEVNASNGEKVRYGYQDGLLTSVTFLHDHDPSYAASKTYLYEDTSRPYLLTGIINEKGHRTSSWVYDAGGRAIKSIKAGGAEETNIEYFRDGSVRVTNSLGKQTRYLFETVDNVKLVKEIQGEPSANCAAANKNYDYYENGTLKSKTDWQGNVTTYLRDDLGREISRTEAADTLDARTITTEYHPTLNKPVKITEPGKVTTMTYDTEGRLISNTTQSTAAP